MKSMIMIMAVLISGRVLANGYNALDSLKFTNAQVNRHVNKSQAMTQIARNCLEDYRKNHLEFYQANCKQVRHGFFNRRTESVCISKYYGDRRYSKRRFQRRGDGKFLEYLGSELNKYDYPLSIMNEMESISCVGMAMKCLEKSFVQTGQNDSWQIVRRFALANGTGGTAIQEALRRLGWTIMYWNPASPSNLVERAQRWDQEEKRWQSKGWHAYRYNSIKTKGTYWYNKVDDATTLVGFEKQTPQYLYSVPFWVGIANTGYHVFPGTFEQVVEAHSTRHITSKDNLEFSPFNPLGGQGPKWTGSEKYRSGLIAIPPTY